MRPLPLCLLASIAVAAFAQDGARESGSTDAFFPAAPEAAEAFSIHDGHFLMHGQPVLIISGEIHYARVPRELWRDRLVRAKRMGLNCIQTYCFWNAHEPEDGRFEFGDRLDLDAWLSLTQELGMYAIVRPGPYNCAEWEAGGLPSWLTSRPGMEVRNASPEYLRYAERYYEHVIPVIAKHQIHRGGNVIMMQIENEYLRDWGTRSTAYTQRLREKAVELGMQVPLFNSGFHHGSAPAGVVPFGKREWPWYCSEFWTGWYTGSGEFEPERIRATANENWKMLAFGGSGYSYYVVHGGTNFGYCNNNECRTTYDYQTSIGEDGQIRRMYGALKRPSWFAASFNDLLARADDAPDSASSTVPQARVHCRDAGRLGMVVFVENTGKEPIRTEIRLAEAGATLPVALDGLEVRPLLAGVPLDQERSIAWLSSSVMSRTVLGDRTYLVCHGRPGEQGEIAIACPSSPGEGWAWDPLAKRARRSFAYPPNDSVSEIAVTGSARKTMFLVMNTALAERTWPTDRAVFVGPAFVAEDLSMQFPPKGGRAMVYTATGRKDLVQEPVAPTAIPELAAWTGRNGDTEAQASCDDREWDASPQPLPMSRYHDFQNAFGWYRTTLDSSDGEPATLICGGLADKAEVFVNGKPQGEATDITIPLRPERGANTLAFLVSHRGRDKMFNFSGPTGQTHFKGIWGPPRLQVGRFSLDSWRISMVPREDATRHDPDAFIDPAFDDSAWGAARLDAHFIPPSAARAWYRTSVDLRDPPFDAAYLVVERLTNFAEAFINGKRVDWPGKFRGSISVEVGSLLRPGGNLIAIRVDKQAGTGGIDCVPVLLLAGKPLPGTWRFRGGAGGMVESALLGTVRNWERFLAGAWADDEPTIGRPHFWRCDFSRPIPAVGRTTVELVTNGLSSGWIWLNGRNLGQYRNDPKAKAPTALYVPEPWFGPMNTLVVYDFDGRSPARVSLRVIESSACSDYHP